MCMFARLPLRTERQARCSKIKQVRYDKAEVLKLLAMTSRCAHNLLLFTQNVLRLQVYGLADGATPAQSKLLFEIEKVPLQVVRELSSQAPPPDGDVSVTEQQRALIANSRFLHAVNAYAQAKQAKGRIMEVAAIPQSSVAISTVPRVTPDGERCLQVRAADACLAPQHWLVSSCMGQEAALEFARARNSAQYVAVGGVALPLQRHDDVSFLPRSDLKGAAFCYLPLPILTGLPVHVNAAFAISSSRRTLYEQTSDDKDATKSTWNQVRRHVMALVPHMCLDHSFATFRSFCINAIIIIKHTVATSLRGNLLSDYAVVRGCAVSGAVGGRCGARVHASAV